RVPGVFGPWMAEYVVGWCSWVTQRMRVYRDAQRQRRWLDHVLPDRLLGKTLTIVGLGDIGRDIARIARGLGMRVLGVTRRGRPRAASAEPPAVEARQRRGHAAHLRAEHARRDRAGLQRQPRPLSRRPAASPRGRPLPGVLTCRPDAAPSPCPNRS